jgi:hypothetical protein
MGAYHTLDNHKDDKTKNLDEKKDGMKRNPLMTACLIKKIVKLYKTHRSAADFDLTVGLLQDCEYNERVEESVR